MTKKQTVTFNQNLSYLTAGIGAVNSLYGAINQSQMAKIRGEFEALQAETNARYASLRAKEMIQQGNKLAATNDRKIKKLLGSQRANLAAQGISINSGSAADVQQQTIDYGRYDSENIRNNAWRQAFGLKQQSIADELTASSSRISSKQRSSNAIASGLIGVSNQAITLLGKGK